MPDVRTRGEARRAGRRLTIDAVVELGENEVVCVHSPFWVANASDADCVALEFTVLGGRVRVA